MKIDTVNFIKLVKGISFSIGDQGLYSFANFLLNILLVRWLAFEQYGVFAFGFSVFLFLSGFHNSLILEPISVLAMRNHKSHLWSYLGLQIRFHFIVVIILGLFCIFISGLVSFYSDQISMSLFYAGISTPFLLSFWFLRRLCYIESNPLIAVIGSSFYSILLLFSLFLFHLFDCLSPLFGFIIMSFSSLFSSILIWILLKRKYSSTLTIFLPIKEILREQWNYSKWATGVTILYWINSFIAIPALGIIIGLEASGIFRGLQNIILPLQQIGAALGNLFVPWFSSQDHGNKKKIQKISFQTIFGFSFLGIIYLIPILLIPEKLLSLLYNEAQMNNYIYEVRLVGVVGLITMIIASLSIILQGLKKPNGIFWANCFGSFFSIFVTISLILKKGLLGAIEGSIITLTVILFILSYFYFRSYTEKNIDFSKNYETN